MFQNKKLYKLIILSFSCIYFPDSYSYEPYHMYPPPHKHLHQHYQPSYIIEDNTGKNITNLILDKRSPNCRDYVGNYYAVAKDQNLDKTNTAYMSITSNQNTCTITSNAIPNHTYDDGKRTFPNKVTTQYQRYTIPKDPSFADKITPLSLRMDNAVMLNGVKVDLRAAGCYGVGDGKIGCFNSYQKWRYNPLYKKTTFNMDSHNAHTQPDGTYHYHGSPNALFDNHPNKESPVVGFAADGFPIYGSHVKRGDKIVPVESSYQLKKGARPEGNGSPGGTYDGKFIDDYKYISGSGDLDECNGMMRNGHYAYYVTQNYPYIINCFRGNPNRSFMKKSPRR